MIAFAFNEPKKLPQLFKNTKRVDTPAKMSKQGGWEQDAWWDQGG